VAKGKEIEVKKSAEIAIAQYDQGDWGADNAENRDMLMPRLALMHATSKLVQADKAVAGEMINTATGKVVAAKGELLEIIPVKLLPKTWVVSVDKKYARTELAKPGEEREWEEETPEGTIKNERCLNFYVLLRKELESGEAIPYMLSFKGTSFKAGQKLVNHFKLSQGLKKAPARTAWKLGSENRSNDTNTWKVWSIEEGDFTTAEEIGEAYQWLQRLKAFSDENVTKYEQDDVDDGAGGTETFRDVSQGTVSDSARF
jgi:hypothetical protein